MLTESEFFKKIDLKCFPDIKNKLLNLHHDALYPIQKKAVDIKWSHENYLDLYDEIEDLARSLETTVTVSKFLIIPANLTTMAHVDGTFTDNMRWALNIPIVCAESNHYMSWYDYAGEYINNFNGAYRHALLAKEPNRLKRAARLTILEPHLVKVGILHSIENQNNMPRITLTIRFLKSFFPSGKFTKN